MALAAWAVPELSKILPLDNESLKEVVDYAATLSKDAAAEHLKNLLGDSPQAFEFIASFNSRRQAPPLSSQSGPSSKPASGTVTPREDLSEVPKAKRHVKKVNKFNQLPAVRRPEDHGNTAGGYIKRDEGDYMTSKPKAHSQKEAHHLADTLALHDKPDALQLPLPVSGAQSRSTSPKAPPSASGPLISDIQAQSKSRSSSPAKTKAKVSVTGGIPMHGASTALNDLDSAIRTLELQTNPSLSSFSAADNAKRRCTCMASRHPLLEAAPNCLNCGKIICVKEGLGPCTFCEQPLLSNAEIQSMIRVLKEERGKERMEANNATQKRAEVSKAPRPFANLAKPGASMLSPGSPFASTPASSAPSSDSETEKLTRAKEHRDRLLAFQANNARRTRVHDEAADFETTTAGLNMWASPQERALQLKRQQKVLREQEWNARPEWEKRHVVASIDVSTGKVMKRMEKTQRPQSPDSDVGENSGLEAEDSGGPVQASGGRGAFSRNPLLGKMIKPMAKVEDNGKGKRQEEKRDKRPTWRRVQDDETDNEAIILDGGAFGGEVRDTYVKAEEPPCG